MSVVVAIKDGDKVWMACDSQVSMGWSTKKTLTNPNNYKICRPEKDKNTLIGVVGDLKLQNIIRVQDEFVDELTRFKNEFNFKYVVNTIVPKIFKLSHENQLVEKVKDQPIFYFNGGLTFAHKDKLYLINSDGCVTEVDDYCADGSGFRFAVGYLNQNTDETKKDAIIKAVKSSCESDMFVNYPIIVMNTMDEEVIIIEK